MSKLTVLASHVALPLSKNVSGMPYEYVLAYEARQAIKSLEDRIEHLIQALEEIAALENVTEIRGPLENVGAPSHVIDADGWGPMHPQMKRGLEYAARKAKEALRGTR